MPDRGVASPSTLPGRCERRRADASVTEPAVGVGAAPQHDRGGAFVG